MSKACCLCGYPVGRGHLDTTKFNGHKAHSGCIEQFLQARRETVALLEQVKAQEATENDN